MKRVFFLVGMLALAACDRPQYDMQLRCGVNNVGDMLVNAKIYKSHADLKIKRLSKKRYRFSDAGVLPPNIWSMEPSWLWNQIPLIDDEIELILPAVREYSDYEIEKKIIFQIRRSGLTGGLNFTLGHMNTKTGFVMDCYPEISPINIEPKNVSKAKLKEIKNCLAYIEFQIEQERSPEGKWRIRLYDEETGRQLYLYEEDYRQIFGDVDLSHFRQEDIRYYIEDVMNACDVAERLRQYIKAHIDTEYIQKLDSNHLVEE